MKYAILVLVALLGLLLAGCGGNDTDVVMPVGGGEPSGQQTSVQDTTPSAQTAQSLTLSSAEEALASDKLKKGERVAVSTPYKVMDIGEVYVFAVAVKNIYPKEYSFRIQPKLDDAKSSGLANLIHTDSTIEGWLAKNRFTVFTLGMQEEKVLPLIVEVGPKVAQDQDTISGSYTFNVLVEYEKTSRFWEGYNDGEDLLTIKIK